MHWLSALSSYPDKALNYQQNEKQFNTLIEDSFKQSYPKSAFNSFMSISAGRKMSQTSKLALKMMKCFQKEFGEKLHLLSTRQLIMVLSKFTSHHWMQSDTYNYILNAMATHFDKFTPREFGKIAKCFSLISLRQEDALDRMVERVVEITSKDKPIVIGTLRSYIYPMFNAYVQMNLTESLKFQTLISDEYVKQVSFGEKRFFDDIPFGADKVKILANILRARLDEKDEKFRDYVILSFTLIYTG